MAKHMDFSKLFTFVQKLRLYEEKRIITEKLKKNKEEVKIGNNWDKLKIEINNFRKSIVASAGNYENKNNDINEEIIKFNEKNKEVISEPEANELLLVLNEEDRNGVAKLMFNINVILDKDYKYTYPTEGLRFVSKFINRDENEIITIKNELERYYRAIADKSLSSTQKGILAGVAIASLAAVILIPVAAAGGIGVSTTAGLAAGFGDMQIGVGLLAFSGALLGTALVGGTYLTLKEYNEIEIKNEFRKLNAEEIALQFAINALIIHHLKEKLNGDDFKDRLDAILKEMNILKSDLDYFLFVEKNDTTINRAKLKIFYGFDKVLLDLLEIK